jgi:hypothetical protein
MRALVSAIGYCETTGRRLIVDWPRFGQGITDENNLFLAKMHDIWKHPYEEQDCGYDILSKSFVLGVDEDEQVIRTCSPETFQPWKFNLPLSEYANRLIPSEEVQQRIDHVSIPDGCIGVHIRYTIRQSMTEHPEWYAAQIMQLDAPIFLSADAKCVEDYIRKVRPDVIVQEKDYRYDRQGIIGSAADLYLLAQCDRMIGAYSSSYSQMASWMLSGGPEPSEWLSGVDYSKHQNWIVGSRYRDSRNA